jgi:hypothetical protein
MKRMFIRINNNQWHKICYLILTIQSGIELDEGVSTCHRQAKKRRLFLILPPHPVPLTHRREGEGEKKRRMRWKKKKSM